jgi:phage terminase small subunit
VTDTTRKKPTGLLKPKHALFLKTYLGNGRNASAAARAAGYSEKTSADCGSRLLKHPDIIAQLSRLQTKTEKNLDLSLDRLLTEVSHAAMFDPGELYDEAGNEIPIHKLPEHVRRAIASIEQDKDYRKLRMVSKTTSQELLAKLAGWLKQENHQQQAVQIILQAPPVLPEPVDTSKLLPEWE